MSVRAQAVGAAAAALFSVVAFASALADEPGAPTRSGMAGSPGVSVREACFRGPGRRARCRYKMGSAAFRMRVVRVRRIVEPRPVYRRAWYASYSTCTISTVAGATTLAPLYNRPVDICFRQDHEAF